MCLGDLSRLAVRDRGLMPLDGRFHAKSIFPQILKLAQVILLPKVNEFRVPHLDNLRCISLLPALGKCLEKLFVNRICWYLRRGDFLSSDQYGFTPHKSTEYALLRLNEIVTRGKKKHLHSILISLDIKDAFDNAWWPCILNLLKKAEIPINIFSLVADFLNDRVAKMQLGSTSAIHCLERGFPQGSVSGPIFWNIIINDLLSKLNNLACCEIIAFADDILVCSQGRDLSATFLHAQEALNFASDWSKVLNWI
ncbi:RNA-directed DNA polymerase from mobile element jockey [Trichonephila clavipes]|uniref:RNA-directed DNA polymerase from mobile element jockey n=1 Tax=Trichonephila clavipes TaxID=2585209 RepID=A0A8X6R6N9_TRICX|nr:RNA-directed DNA polymerase from mobile element jockey [Trichonephila clavipes]